MAVAKEQEMKASVQEMRAKVVEAEAEVPLAMAEAFRKTSGHGLLQHEKHPCRYQHEGFHSNHGLPGKQQDTIDKQGDK